jgi:hypothetical protein
MATGTFEGSRRRARMAPRERPAPGRRHALRAALVGLTLSLFASGCIAPPPPAVRATDAARELNIAARFGRLDIAASRTAPSARKAFMERRASWGRDLRIVDTEMSGFEMTEPDAATVYVDVAWVRMDQGTVRLTRVAQNWKDQKGGWLLTRERRVSGELGLFGDAPPPVEMRRPDVHFQSKTIR